MSTHAQDAAAFQLVSDYDPSGDQPAAIAQLTDGVNNGLRFQTLLGVTGSGKTYTMANVIRNVNRPALVISHNKVLAAQLYSEFREFFPHNAVGYFVSYYDYYQPEAYIPQTDTYIEKDATINDELDRLRLAATTALLERRDVIIVASVSCIYGLGAPEEYTKKVLFMRRGDTFGRQDLLYRLVQLLYERNDYDFYRGTFRAAGDVVDIFPAYGEVPVRIELFGDEIDRIAELDPVTSRTLRELDTVAIYPAKHYITSEERMQTALKTIRMELDERLAELNAANQLVEAQRLDQRTRYDMELLSEMGICQGVENYSRHLDQREPGEAPYTLLDYFPEDFLVFVDESHMMLPQIRGMYAGDRSRKETLVKYGFRLPSALDNRPLKFDEWVERVGQAVFVSATPGKDEAELSDQTVEQIVRPTGLVDPAVEVLPATGQVDNLIGQIRERVANNERVLVTTLTRRMSEDLTEYLRELSIRVQYLHFQVDTVERVDIIEALRKGDYDVIVGVNLLREGLDLPEVTLVAILDADKEGFLRDTRSLIQTCGRAARNVGGKVIMYADKVTQSMQRALDEVNRRREKQLEYNAEHGIEPRTIEKKLRNILDVRHKHKEEAERMAFELFEGFDTKARAKSPADVVKELKRQMVEAAKNLEFEKAAVIRDKLSEVEEELKDAPASDTTGRKSRTRKRRKL